MLKAIPKNSHHQVSVLTIFDLFMRCLLLEVFEYAKEQNFTITRVLVLVAFKISFLKRGKFCVL